MKIAFLSTCLEPGRDGVGDYTALLARECARRGHEARLVSLNDVYINGASSDSNGGLLRLSGLLPWPQRVAAARDFLSSFEPDAVSLQFVCYGFHPRGIDFALASRLGEMLGGIPVQIMFHELWIGAAAGAAMRERITGALQRACVLRVARALNVRAVHTSNAAYVEMLRRQKIAASVLPLFGSIPFPPAGLPSRNPDGTLAFGMFGTLHPVWPPEPLFSMLRSTGKKISLTHIGHIGAGEALWKKMERDYAGEIAFRMLGEQSPEQIARIFRSEIDFGIATTPWQLAGKSATVAAMIEHGLPVIVNRDDWRLAGDFTAPAISPQLIKMDGSLPEKLTAAHRVEPHSLLPSVADQFLASLERAT